MSEVLDGSLELIITVEVCGPSCWVNSLSELRLEAVHNETNFETGVAGKDGVAVNFLEFKRPAGNQDDFLVEVANFGGWELLFKIVEGSLSEVGGNVKVGVADEEVGVCLLNENLEHLLA